MIATGPTLSEWSTEPPAAYVPYAVLAKITASTATKVAATEKNFLKNRFTPDSFLATPFRAADIND
ncbi:MAG: hypothetical protein HYV65_01115 [Candidatus Spechtbacteria bacterium]|nr:hypothetical protein [Candidatus Spechtbacteria bacterium]